MLISGNDIRIYHIINYENLWTGRDQLPVQRFFGLHRIRSLSREAALEEMGLCVFRTSFIEAISMLSLKKPKYR